jgi:ABC-type sugar transport system ATPase subunit
VTVFRDGRSVQEFERRSLTRQHLVEAIVGGRPTEEQPVRQSAAGRKVALRVENLARLPRVRGVSFNLHEGEVLGLGGLVGAGRTELARLIYGADQPDSGSMSFGGAPFAPKTPHAAVKAGLGLVPEERRAEGLILTKSVAFNVSLANLKRIIMNPALPLISGAARNNLTLEIIRALSIKTESPETPVGRLSGGNQQKVVIGRWFASAPRVLILDEPTRGVDIGARIEIHRLIRGLAEKGMAVLVISSEPEELPDVCDRVLVMAEGRIVRELAGSAVSRSAIVEASYVEPHHSERLAT